MKKTAFFILLFVFSSCVSTKSTLKNIDDNAADLVLTANNTFDIKLFSTDKKYGYDANYPINIFYKTTNPSLDNPERFLNALAGPNGEKISYQKLENCCPFPTKKSDMGVGLLSVYEIKWDGQKKPVILYLNTYERGTVLVPFGFQLKK